MLQGILNMLAERMGIIGKAAWRFQGLETMICALGELYTYTRSFHSGLKDGEGPFVAQHDQPVGTERRRSPSTRSPPGNQLQLESSRELSLATVSFTTMSSTFVVLDICEDITDKIRGDMLEKQQVFQHSNEHDEPSHQGVFRIFRSQ